MWTSEARAALYRQHDIPGASITSVRVCTDIEGDADYLVAGDGFGAEDATETYGKAA